MKNAIEIRLLVVCDCPSVRGTDMIDDSVVLFAVEPPRGAKDLWRRIHTSVGKWMREHPELSARFVVVAHQPQTKKTRLLDNPDQLAGQPGAAKTVWQALVA